MRQRKPPKYPKRKIVKIYVVSVALFPINPILLSVVFVVSVFRGVLQWITQTGASNGLYELQKNTVVMLKLFRVGPIVF